MRWPRGEQEVPVTSKLGGLVFVLALFSVADPVHEALVFGGWGVVYAVECVVRRRRQANYGEGVTTPAP